MPREKTVKIDLRISERDAKRLNELMKMGDWNRSEALRFVLNFSYVVMDMIPAALVETFVDGDGFLIEEDVE
jgi:hypothetical protein